MLLCSEKVNKQPFVPSGITITSLSGLQEEFGVKFVYAWHSLHGYWAGVAVGSNPAMPYGAQLVMPQPTPGRLLPHTFTSLSSLGAKRWVFDEMVSNAWERVQCRITYS